MEDVQARPDDRGVVIQQAGVSELMVPITVLDRTHGKQQTIARMSMSVGIPHHFKGTHMSRFIEVIEEHRGEVTMRTLPVILAELRRRLDAETARIELEFPYFIERAAPVTGARALMDVRCAFMGEVTAAGDDFLLTVTVPVTSLCPCSKTISDYGAHNQRTAVTMQVRTVARAFSAEAILWIEDLVEVADGASSCPVYPLLKRADERHVTMQAFDNPKFVEDIVRDVALALRDDSRVRWFKARARSDESIHNHCAFAEVEWTRGE
jgi:GTP cyclohydrolase IB